MRPLVLQNTLSSAAYDGTALAPGALQKTITQKQANAIYTLVSTNANFNNYVDVPVGGGAVKAGNFCFTTNGVAAGKFTFQGHQLNLAAAGNPDFATFLLQVVGDVYQNANAAPAAAPMRAAETKALNGIIVCPSLKTAYNLSSKPSMYGFSRSDLIVGYGQYCAYCGERIPDIHLEVEHTLPKDSFLDESINFNNFLLSCSNCNSIKSAKPDIDVVVTQVWAPAAPAANFRTAFFTLADYTAIKTAIQNNYIWPIAPKAYQKFSLEMYDTNPLGGANPGQPTGAAIAHSYNTNNRWRSTKQNVVSAKINGVNKTVCVQESGNTPKAKRMEDLVGLNKIQSDPRSSDRRVVNRTVVWLTALKAVSNLNDTITNTAGLPAATQEEIYDTLWNQVLATAKYAGHYSVWVNIFDAWNATLAPPGTTGGLVADFVSGTADQHYFPGTETTNVP